MGMILQEVAELLDPPMTVRQLRTLIIVAGIKPSGARRTGRRGHPVGEYDADMICRAHAEEAARTAKQFTDRDWVASALLARQLIGVDPDEGTLWWPAGGRAERLLATLYGVVDVGPISVAAHRVIWIAADGEIPVAMQVNHINKRRWDNRRPNLELTSFGNNIRHAYGHDYLTYHDAVRQLAELPPPPSDAELLATRSVLAEGSRAGGAFHARY